MKHRNGLRFLGISVLLLLLGGNLAAQESGLVRINAPYVQTPPEVVSAMLEMAGVTGKDIVYDLGCGNGNIVIAAAHRYGARAVGIDLDANLLKEAENNARKAGLSGKVRFMRQDIFDADVSEATVVTLYLLPEVNRELLPRLLQALKPGARIVSHAFDFGPWQPEKALEVSGCKIFLWIVPEKGK